MEPGKHKWRGEASLNMEAAFRYDDTDERYVINDRYNNRMDEHFVYEIAKDLSNTSMHVSGDAFTLLLACSILLFST